MRVKETSRHQTELFAEARKSGMPKRGYHHGNLRQALVDAALELIESKGPTGFTLSEAAKQAGGSLVGVGLKPGSRELARDEAVDRLVRPVRALGGRLGRRPITGPPSDKTRPTTDRVREALFSALGAVPLARAERNDCITDSTASRSPDPSTGENATCATKRAFSL